MYTLTCYTTYNFFNSSKIKFNVYVQMQQRIYFHKYREMITFYFQCTIINYLVSVGFSSLFRDNWIYHLKIKIQSIYMKIYLSHRITTNKITPYKGVQWRNKAEFGRRFWTCVQSHLYKCKLILYLF